MSTRRDNPPSNWIPDVTTIDEGQGIYLAPSHLEDAPNPVFWHWCTKTSAGARWVGMRTPLHEVLSTDPWELTPSLLCDMCGLHGFIRDGRWHPA